METSKAERFRRGTTRETSATAVLARSGRSPIAIRTMEPTAQCPLATSSCGRISPRRLVRRLPMSHSGSTPVLRLPRLTSSIPIARMKNPSSSRRRTPRGPWRFWLRQHVDSGKTLSGLFHLGARRRRYHDLRGRCEHHDDPRRQSHQLWCWWEAAPWRCAAVSAAASTCSSPLSPVRRSAAPPHVCAGSHRCLVPARLTSPAALFPASCAAVGDGTGGAGGQLRPQRGSVSFFTGHISGSARYLGRACTSRYSVSISVPPSVPRFSRTQLSLSASDSCCCPSASSLLKTTCARTEISTKKPR